MSARDETTKRPYSSRWKLAVLVIIGYVGYVGFQGIQKYLDVDRDVRTIRGIVAAEEVILELTPRLDGLARSVLNLRLPDQDGHSLFLDSVSVADLDREDETRGSHDFRTISARARDWPSSVEPRDVPAKQLDLWRPLLDEVEYFDHAKFYFVDGRFTDEQFDEFQSDVGFKGLARTRSGTWRGVSAKQHVVWQRISTGAQETDSDWRISSWHLANLETIDSPQLLFVESLDRALPDSRDLKRARHSLHQQSVVEYYRGGARQLPERYFAPISANQKPGLSVVDVDGDGWDDLYVTVRMGHNQLLRNRGDGTFEEVAAKLGLDVAGHSTSAIFADFDNDGDPDLMLGRSIQRSMYLENSGGHFEERNVTGGDPLLPYLVVSMSAADYNSDGLLDVYFSTYRPAVLENLVSSRHDDGAEPTENPLEGVAAQATKWPDEFLSGSQASEYYARANAKSNGSDHYSNVLDQIGPPNVLLVNRGHGHFEPAPETAALALWRNTLQATWCDFDEDGDPDLYVANDWAPDNLFRNDGANGFVDITREAGTTQFGFAMGVTWGDYDNDGQQDLYVSNMYSKAGRRITAQIGELDPSYGRSVEGNFLYRNLGGRFELVSGLKPPALTVAEAGWSWGGQFADVDNDGFLDLYVLSGYFTAPREFASQVDL